MHKNTNTHTQIQHMTKCQKDPICGIFLKRGLFKDIKNDIPTCQTHKYKIHKYTNTAYDEVPERPNMCYIFEKRIVQGYQKLYSHVPNTQIQKHKYKIHKYSIWRSSRKTQHVVYFWKEDCSWISKIIFPCAKRINTKIQIQYTQIQHMTKCQKDPTCGIFLKRGLFKEIKNYISIQYKLEHLSFAQLYEVQAVFLPLPILIY